MSGLSEGTSETPESKGLGHGSANEQHLQMQHLLNTSRQIILQQNPLAVQQNPVMAQSMQSAHMQQSPLVQSVGRTQAPVRAAASQQKYTSPAFQQILNQSVSSKGMIEQHVRGVVTQAVPGKQIPSAVHQVNRHISPKVTNSAAVQSVVTGLSQQKASISAKNMVYVDASQLQRGIPGQTSQNAQATQLPPTGSDREPRQQMLTQKQFATQLATLQTTQTQVVSTGIHVVEAAANIQQQTVRRPTILPTHSPPQPLGYKGVVNPHVQMTQIENANLVIMPQSVNSQAIIPQSSCPVSQQLVQGSVMSAVAVNHLSQANTGVVNQYVASQQQNVINNTQTGQVTLTEALQQLGYSPQNIGNIPLRPKVGQVNAVVGQTSNSQGQVTIVGKAGQVSTIMTPQGQEGVQHGVKDASQNALGQMANQGQSRIRIATESNINAGPVFTSPQQHGTIQKMVVTQGLLQKLASAGVQSKLNQIFGSSVSLSPNPSHNKNVSEFLVEQKRKMEALRNQAQCGSTNNVVVNTVHHKQIPKHVARVNTCPSTPDIKIASVSSLHVPPCSTISTPNMVQTVTSSSTPQEHPKRMLSTSTTETRSDNESYPDSTSSASMSTPTSSQVATPNSSEGSTRSPCYSVKTPLKVANPKGPQTAQIVDKDVFFNAISQGMGTESLPAADLHTDGKHYIMIYSSGSIIEAVFRGKHFAVIPGSSTSLAQRIAAMKKLTNSPVITSKQVQQQKPTAELKPGQVESVRGGGRGRTGGNVRGRGCRGRKRGGLRGGATNFSMVSRESSPLGEVGVDPPEQETLKRRPIHSDVHDVSSDAAGILENGALESQEKEKRATKPGVYAVCPHCGTCSQDYDFCDSCHKPLPDDVKMHDGKIDPQSKIMKFDATNSSSESPGVNEKFQVGKQLKQKVIGKIDPKMMYGKTKKKKVPTATLR